MSPRALVTGGSGYFGSLLTASLVDAGYDVRVLDLHRADDAPSRVEFVQGDICDAARVRETCEGMDVVFHNVAQVPLARDTALFDRVNVGGTANLLHGCEAAGVGKVVYTSSSAVYGVPSTNPVTRSTPPRPMEAYGRAKHEGELLCRAAVTRGLDVSIVRPRTILGHGRLGIFGILFDWIRAGADVPVLGSGDNRYQFVHAEDVACACILAAQRSGPADYNIGAEVFGTMRETLEDLCAYAGTGSSVRSIPMAPAARLMQLASAARLAPFGPYHWLMYGKEMWFDLTPAHDELGWHSTYTTDAMFRESYDWFLAHDGEHESGSAHRRSARQGILRLGRALMRA